MVTLKELILTSRIYEESLSVTGRIQGKVVEVTDHGDLITDLLAGQLEGVNCGPETKVTVDDEHETFGIFGADHNQPSMTLVAVLVPSEALRLHLVDDSAAMMLGVQVGASVEVSW
ncbi:MAG: adenosylmethionine-8-amino-7-oxononanoate aminotransferase [Planctomycetes bacterium]|nr:adenosylmethionine-8-amino-7-oxononanoate aminotransferase [Planctomycetota bacterium]